MRKRINLHFDIEKEIEICKHQPVVFWADTELGDLYSAIAEHFGFNKASAANASVFYNLGRTHGIREERIRRNPAKMKKTAINTQIVDLATKLALELSRSTPEDYLELKLMMFAYSRHEKTKEFLQKVFTLAEERRPLLIEMK